MTAVRAKLFDLLVRQGAQAEIDFEKRVEERAQQIADERAAAVKQEHQPA
jgi:hypothetical protein